MEEFFETDIFGKNASKYAKNIYMTVIYMIDLYDCANLNQLFLLFLPKKTPLKVIYIVREIQKFSFEFLGS